MRFNQYARHESRVLNHEEAVAFQTNAKMELYAAVVTNLLNDHFYEKDGDRLERIKELIAQNDPKFVAQLAVYACEKMYLRTTPIVLAVELAKIHHGDDLVGKLVKRVVQSADEITELLAYYTLANKRRGFKKLNRLSKQIQKGLAGAFNRFDGYQFAKYNRKTAIKLKDALFLVHPKAKSEEQQMLFDKIIRDELEPPYTWETELSKVGQMGFKTDAQEQVVVSATWEALVLSKKLGYLVLLRNLRNILQTQPKESVVKEVCQQLTDPVAIRKSKVFPFQFLAAYRELETPDLQVTEPRRSLLGWDIPLKKTHLQTNEPVSKILEALETAVLLAIENMAGVVKDTRLCIACDVSGSMFLPISKKSKVQLFDVGLMLGMMLKAHNKQVITGIFGDTWKRISLPQSEVLKNVGFLRQRQGEVGYSTNGHKVLENLHLQKTVVDKVMIFTDCQMWDADTNGEAVFAKAWKRYKDMSPNAKLYLFDLAGYGRNPIEINKNDVYLIAGWSDKVFEVLEGIENQYAALSMIEEIEI